jgi:hypothetical protein
MINPEAVSTKRQANSFKVHGCYKVSKIKEKYSDCQDSYSLSTESTRVAISDGATQSFYSGLWSQILCDLYCSWPNPISHSQWNEWNEFARAQWIDEVNIKLGELKESGKPSWIECLNGIKLKKDAFATFIGISLDDLYLHGICIGDSCAILVRITKEDPTKEACCEAPSIIRIFPGLWQHSFDSRTTGLSSYNSDFHHLPEFFRIPIPVEKNDYRILLMTDALAHYVIDMEGKGLSILSSLLSLSTQEEFAQYIDISREAGLANDDTTLVVVEISDTADFSALDIGQRDIDRSRSLVIADPQVHERLADAINQDSVCQLQPSVDPLPLALPRSSLGAAEVNTFGSEIDSKQESSTLSQANTSSNESDQELQSENEIPDQSAIGFLNPTDKAEVRLLDSPLDKDKKISSRSISLPSLGKKNRINARRSPSTANNIFRRFCNSMKCFLRSQL